MKPLVFSFVVSLSDEIVIQGTIHKASWQTQHLKTPQQAAWAYVRGLLEKPGEYRIFVAVDGLVDQREIVVVEDEEGALLRSEGTSPSAVIEFSDDKDDVKVTMRFHPEIDLKNDNATPAQMLMLEKWSALQQ